MSYAVRASRFLAERRGRDSLADASREISEECEKRSRLGAWRFGSGCPIDGDSPREISEISEEMSASMAGAAWNDPKSRPLPPDSDAWDRGARTSYGAILHLPPRGCIGPIVCSRLGPCQRHAAGQGCEVAS